MPGTLIKESVLNIFKRSSIGLVGYREFKTDGTPVDSSRIILTPDEGVDINEAIATLNRNGIKAELDTLDGTQVILIKKAGTEPATNYVKNVQDVKDGAKPNFPLKNGQLDSQIAQSNNLKGAISGAFNKLAGVNTVVSPDAGGKPGAVTLIFDGKGANTLRSQLAQLGIPTPELTEGPGGTRLLTIPAESMARLHGEMGTEFPKIIAKSDGKLHISPANLTASNGEIVVEKAAKPAVIAARASVIAPGAVELKGGGDGPPRLVVKTEQVNRITGDSIRDDRLIGQVQRQRLELGLDPVNIPEVLKDRGFIAEDLPDGKGGKRKGLVFHLPESDLPAARESLGNQGIKFQEVEGKHGRTMLVIEPQDMARVQTSYGEQFPDAPIKKARDGFEKLRNPAAAAPAKQASAAQPSEDAIQPGTPEGDAVKAARLKVLTAGARETSRSSDHKLVARIQVDPDGTIKGVSPDDLVRQLKEQLGINAEVKHHVDRATQQVVGTFVEIEPGNSLTEFRKLQPSMQSPVGDGGYPSKLYKLGPKGETFIPDPRNPSKLDGLGKSLGLAGSHKDLSTLQADLNENGINATMIKRGSGYMLMVPLDGEQGTKFQTLAGATYMAGVGDSPRFNSSIQVQEVGKPGKSLPQKGDKPPNPANRGDSDSPAGKQRRGIFWRDGVAPRGPKSDGDGNVVDDGTTDTPVTRERARQAEARRATPPATAEAPGAPKSVAAAPTAATPDTTPNPASPAPPAGKPAPQGSQLGARTTLNVMGIGAGARGLVQGDGSVASNTAAITGIVSGVVSIGADVADAPKLAAGTNVITTLITTPISVLNAVGSFQRDDYAGGTLQSANAALGVGGALTTKFAPAFAKKIPLVGGVLGAVTIPLDLKNAYDETRGLMAEDAQNRADDNRLFSPMPTGEYAALLRNPQADYVLAATPPKIADFRSLSAVKQVAGLSDGDSPEAVMEKLTVGQASVKQQRDALLERIDAQEKDRPVVSEGEALVENNRKILENIYKPDGTMDYEALRIAENRFGASNPLLTDFIRLSDLERRYETAMAEVSGESSGIVSYRTRMESSRQASAEFMALAEKEGGVDAYMEKLRSEVEKFAQAVEQQKSLRGESQLSDALTRLSGQNIGNLDGAGELMAGYKQSQEIKEAIAAIEGSSKMMADPAVAARLLEMKTNLAMTDLENLGRLEQLAARTIDGTSDQVVAELNDPARVMTREILFADPERREALQTMWADMQARNAQFNQRMAEVPRPSPQEALAMGMETLQSQQDFARAERELFNAKQQELARSPIALAETFSGRDQNPFANLLPKQQAKNFAQLDRNRDGQFTMADVDRDGDRKIDDREKKGLADLVGAKAAEEVAALFNKMGQGGTRLDPQFSAPSGTTVDLAQGGGTRSAGRNNPNL